MSNKSMKIALAGNPNSGKTTLFNALTGSEQYVGNWPGVTVEKKDGILAGHKDVVIQDLPGIYSLSPYSIEEEVGAEKGIGETVSGNYLKPVGISLPISGQISYKSATPVPAYTNTTWRLMSLAMKRTSASDPCLVLAQRIS